MLIMLATKIATHVMPTVTSSNPPLPKWRMGLVGGDTTRQGMDMTNEQMNHNRGTMPVCGAGSSVVKEKKVR
jgi:hypothetical protein